MYRALLLIFATRVSLQTPQSYQHRVFMSRRLRDNVPVQSGFMFSQTNDQPAKFETFGNQHGISLGDGVVKRYSDFDLSDGLPLDIKKSSPFRIRTNPPKSMTLTSMPVLNMKLPIFKTLPDFQLGVTEGSVPYTTTSFVEHSINYEISKAKAQHSDPVILAKAKTDEMLYKGVTSPKYDFSRDFHIDNDDVKASSRNTYEWWPYFVHSPYNYEKTIVDSGIHKAKEKRYASDSFESSERVIPVHEFSEDYNDIHSVSPAVTRYYRDYKPTERTTDNPVAGDEPFFSFVLNDYYDRNKNDDPLTFKGVEWGTDFDTMNLRRDHDDHGKRVNRHYYGDFVDNANENRNFNEGVKQSSGIGTTNGDYEYQGKSDHNVLNGNIVENKNSNDAVKQSSGIHDRGYENIHKFDKHEHGNNLKENNNSDYKYSEDNTNSFKNFVDRFANNFGGEDHKKLSNFSVQKNKENGEKKKGFHRVYHKDEYQEDKEFYDNTGNNSKAEDSGSSVAHVGGSNAGIQSLATATLGNKSDILNKDGNAAQSLYKNNQVGNDSKKGLVSNIDRYIDIARQTANSNTQHSFH